ncbi:MAG: DUF262 domain-containing protein [Streptosporangiaceae bacterium]
MAKSDFEPVRRTIEDLFVGKDYYVIPRFQRPYSWDRANLDDFWRDVIYDNVVGYFIGPMVAWRDEGSSWCRLVDGQQRLTTIAILFSVIRDALRDLGESNLADGVDRYLEKRNRDNELDYTLQPEVDAPYLNRGILKNPPDSSVEPKTEEEKALFHAAQQIRSQVSTEVEKRSNPVKWLTDVRDKMLGLKVIWVEHDNEDDAYILFETLNSRGRDLEVADLLKNLLFSHLRSAGNKKADSVRDDWNTMRSFIEGVGSPSLDVNRFILHWWLSREDYVAQRKLFRVIKSKVRTRPQASATLDSLCDDVAYYRYALDPSSRNWNIEEADIKRSLEALAEFRIIQPAPLLLALLRARFDNNVKLKAPQLISTLQTIERYHFQYTIVSQLSSSGGVSEMYAKAARELYAAQSADKRAVLLKDFRAKLVERRPSREQFVEDFASRFMLTNVSTRDGKLVRYVLRTFLRKLRPGTSLEDLTIEHVMPQEQIGVGGVTEGQVGSIGNLLLISQELNTKLDNKSFLAKREILESDGQPYDIGGIIDKAKWGSEQIEGRARMLGQLAYDDLWKLPV